MKDLRNVYCFRLSFIGNYCYFYRVVAYNKDHAYRKMITELLHETYLLHRYELTSIKLIYTIVDNGDPNKFVHGLNIAAQKYFTFIHHYEQAAIPQYYYLNTHCQHCNYNNICCVTQKTCKMAKGFYCKDYTKGR